MSRDLCRVTRMTNGSGRALVTRGRLAVLATLLAAGPALAGFEGVLEIKSSMSGLEGAQGAHTTMISLSKAGLRFETSTKAREVEVKTVMITRTDKPGTMYRINEADKTYMVIKTPQDGNDGAGAQDTAGYVVKKLGSEKFCGYDTQHVLVTRDGFKMEMWTSKDLFNSDMLSKMQLGADGQGQGFLKALSDAGADGMPLKSVLFLDNGGKVTSEVVNIEKKALPASTFEIPGGYTETQRPMMGGMRGRSPEDAKKRMEEMMKRMPPEQRAEMEKAMKAREGGGE